MQQVDWPGLLSAIQLRGIVPDRSPSPRLQRHPHPLASAPLRRYGHRCAVNGSCRTLCRFSASRNTPQARCKRCWAPPSRLLPCDSADRGEEQCEAWCAMWASTNPQCANWHPAARSTPNAARAPRVGVAEKSEKVSKHEEEEEDFEGDDDGLSPQQVRFRSCQQPSAALPVPPSCAACMGHRASLCALAAAMPSRPWSAFSWRVAPPAHPATLLTANCRQILACSLSSLRFSSPLSTGIAAGGDPAVCAVRGDRYSRGGAEDGRLPDACAPQPHRRYPCRCRTRARGGGSRPGAACCRAHAVGSGTVGFPVFS